MAWLAQRVHPIPFPFARGVALLAGAALAAAMIGRHVPGWSGAAVLAAAALLALICALWLWLGVLEPAERARLLARGARGGS